MFKSIRTLVLAVSLGLLSLTFPAYGQTGTDPGGGASAGQPSGQYGGTASNAGRTDHDWGWIGLLGLVGLAGLFRRREETHPSRVSSPGPAGTRWPRLPEGKTRCAGVNGAVVGLANTRSRPRILCRLLTCFPYLGITYLVATGREIKWWKSWFLLR